MPPFCTPVLRHHLQHFPASATRQRCWQRRGGSSVVVGSCAGPWWSGTAGLEKQMTRRWHLREEKGKKEKETSKSFISSYLSISSIRFMHPFHPSIISKSSNHQKKTVHHVTASSNFSFDHYVSIKLLNKTTSQPPIEARLQQIWHL